MYNHTNPEWATWAAPFLELQQINQLALEKIARECTSFFSDNAAAAVKIMQSAHTVTNAEDFISLQMKSFTQQGERTLAFLQTIFKIYQDIMQDQGQWTKDKVTNVMAARSKAEKG